MTNPEITDLRRELEKAHDALTGTEQHLARHAEMNAALHCSERVMYSPLHAKVTAAIAGIEHALNRTKPAVSISEWATEHSDAHCPWQQLLSELDRCEHGRHEGDECYGCEGLSPGNPHMRPGAIIGYSLRRGPIVMPAREAKHDPKAWRAATTEEPK